MGDASMGGIFPWWWETGDEKEVEILDPWTTSSCFGGDELVSSSAPAFLASSSAASLTSLNLTCESTDGDALGSVANAGPIEMRRESKPSSETST
jgi:hypothetical protein